MKHEGIHTSMTERIISAAIEVHRHLGPGLLESTYENALCYEFELRGISVVRQVAVPLFYKGRLISEHRPDVIVEACVVVEIKSVARLEPVHWAQVLTYLRVTGARVGLIINFNVPILTRGVKRIVL